MDLRAHFASRHMYNVSAVPTRLVTSLDADLDGALYLEATSPSRGELRQEQEYLVFERRLTPLCTRPLVGGGGWTTHGPGAWLHLPGSRIDAEWRGSVQWQYLFVTPERVGAALEKPWDRTGLVRWGRPELEVPFVGRILSSMARDREDGYPTGPLAGDALVVALLSHLDGRPAPTLAPRPGALGRRLDHVVEYIEANLARPLRLSELAGLAGLEVRRFSAVFCAETGWTPHRFLLKRRVERAKVLMRDSKLTLWRIARAVGFANSAQFSRTFRKYAGEPPSAYRRR